ncbi:SPOR domain-containing protein [Nitrosomonas sp. Nm58]|uniref:SPOR domain-containing protein n=1 Tax=Nitrosomonas sp. Nm58 TaxID=200126 RepID=UPI000899B7DF|nr:SPOR domain-containing protein [Nitrosomonas sp. Nm58]SDY78700.1 hypothetical protein SAMN05421754_10227 [Nitrosomonas sp. Nm58]
MKIFFFLLLLVNIVFLMIIQLESNRTNKVHITQSYLEEIRLLPSRVACLKWGNLFGIDLQRIKNNISELELDSYLSELPAGEIIVHWVYILSPKTEREIKRQINKLQKLNMPYQYIQNNEYSQWHNAISFGMLRERSLATQLIEELKSKGILNVNMRRLSLEQVKFVIREPTKEVKEKIFMLAQQFPDSKLEITECERF